MNLPKVTIIVTPRERFSLTQMSLESILADDSYPFDLIYVDGGSPPKIAQYLSEQESQYEFMSLIRCEHYLRTNEAKKFGLSQIKETDYIIFIENDVVVEKGWLAPLVQCAEEENAFLVAPLIFEGDPQLPDPEKQIRVASFDFKFQEQASGKRWLKLYHKMHHVKLKDREIHRSQVNGVILNCVLMRRSLLDKVVFDETFDSVESHRDLSIQARDLGEKVFLEPRSRVTFLSPDLVSGFDWDDLQFYLFKWDEKFMAETFLANVPQKWNLDPNDPYLRGIQRYVNRSRQIPLQWVVSKYSFFQFLLKCCKLSFCPYWLRVAIEKLVVKLTFPQEGIPCNLSHYSNTSKALLPQ